MLTLTILKALNDLVKNQGLGCRGLNMGAINFVWLSGFRAQTGSVAYWCYATFVWWLGLAATPGLGKRGPCYDFASNTLAFALQLRKIKENSHGKRMVLG